MDEYGGEVSSELVVAERGDAKLHLGKVRIGRALPPQVPAVEAPADGLVGVDEHALRRAAAVERVGSPTVVDEAHVAEVEIGLRGAGASAPGFARAMPPWSTIVPPVPGLPPVEPPVQSSRPCPVEPPVEDEPPVPVEPPVEDEPPVPVVPPVCEPPVPVVCVPPVPVVPPVEDEPPVPVVPPVRGRRTARARRAAGGRRTARPTASRTRRCTPSERKQRSETAAGEDQSRSGHAYSWGQRLGFEVGRPT